MRIHAILNARAGTLIDAGSRKVGDEIVTALNANGHSAAIELAEPEGIEAAMDRAIADDPDVLAIGGGDGTIKAAAARLAGTRIALGVIPLGTVNLLARDLGLPFDPVKAANIVANGEARAIDVASVNGDIFLCSSLLGLPIRMAEQRQDLRGGTFAERLHGYARMARDFLANRGRFTIEVDDGKTARRHRALSIAVSNNPLAETAGTFPTRERIDTGKLALYLSKHRTGAAMGWTILRRMAGNWRSDPDLEEVMADRITLHSKRSRVRLSNDGEVVELGTPLRYEIRPRALKVIIPEAGIS